MWIRGTGLVRFRDKSGLSPPKVPQRDLAAVDVTFSSEMETAVLEEE